MSKVRSDVDLSQLRRAEAAPSRPPPRRWLRVVVPVAILVAFAGILVSSLGDLLGKTVDVTVVRPKIADEGSAASIGSVALQASGWVEPDPYPILVPTLVSGVVREVLVQESDAVKAGDPVARLIDDEAKLGLERADAALAEARAEKAKAQVESRFADESFAAALAVTESVAASKALLDGKTAESNHRRAAVKRGESELDLARQELVVQETLAKEGAAGPRAVEIARAKVAQAEGSLETMKADAVIAAKQAEEAAARASRAEREAKLRIDDRQRVESAKAGLALAEAKVRTLEAARKEAALRLDRMTISAPAAGVVMERRASPGSTLVVEDPERSAVCSLFDPANVRVRVDVSQADVPKVAVDQPALVVSQARRQKPYNGKVIRLVQRADIQKVTLQVHVRIQDGDSLLRPEMLCDVKFVAVRGTDSAPSSSGSAAVLIPTRLLVEERFVWAVDSEAATARKRPIEVAGRSGEWVLVRSGLNASDKLIDGGREQLSEGVRVRVREGN
jgi:RND family efflux transporter MFP subunit